MPEDEQDRCEMHPEAKCALKEQQQTRESGEHIAQENIEP